MRLRLTLLLEATMTALPAFAYGELRQPEPGVIRILAGEQMRMPLADLILRGESEAELVPVSAETTVCGDKIVPNIYGQALREARGALLAADWQPFTAPDANAPDEFLQANNITEMQACAGTGLGYCNYTIATRQAMG